MWKYYVLRLAFLLLGRLPLPALYGIARAAGNGAYLVRGDARRAVSGNMRRVMGPDASEREVRAAAKDVFRNASRYYADLIHLQRLDIEQFYRELDIEGIEYLTEAERSGRGGVIAGTHFGNPEMAVQGLAAPGYSIVGLTEPLQPRALSDFTNELRSKHGHVYRTIGFGGVKAAMRRVKDGGLIAILMDRDVGGTGVPMRFFGAEASIPLGAVDLALRTGGDLIPAWAKRIPGYRFRVRIGPPLALERTGDFDADVRRNGERLLALFEEHLRSDPGQWAVLEAIWPQEEQERLAASGALE